MIQSEFFQHIYHIGCAFNLHSIINNGLIPGGQNSSKRQTAFFSPVDPRDKGIKIRQRLTSLYHVVHNTCTVLGRNIKTRYFGLILILRFKKVNILQTRSNAIILQGTLPAYCIPKVVRLKTGEVLYEKSYMSPRPPPKISLRHDHDWTRGNDELGSTFNTQNSPNQPNQSQNQSVIDQGNLRTCKMCCC